MKTTKKILPLENKSFFIHLPHRLVHPYLTEEDLPQDEILFDSPEHLAEHNKKLEFAEKVEKFIEICGGFVLSNERGVDYIVVFDEAEKKKITPTAKRTKIINWKDLHFQILDTEKLLWLEALE